MRVPRCRIKDSGGRVGGKKREGETGEDWTEERKEGRKEGHHQGYFKASGGLSSNA